MQGYTWKKYKNLKMLISDSIVSACSDRQWQDTCIKLFSDGNRDGVQKEGKYKTVLKSDVHDTPCIIKKYRNRGLLRSIKSLFSSSKAMREFQAAVYILERGIPTTPPMLMAEKRKGGVVQESLVALSFLSGARELKDIFFHKKNLPVSERRKIVNDFGRLTGNIFLNGVFQYDYSLNNFMIRKEGEKHRIYFIDFERVETKQKLSRVQKLELLAKLNRVGRQVSITDRLRFLRGYLDADPGIARSVRDLALEIQKKTLIVLKRDLKRCRLTSIYTHGNYEKIGLRGYKGLYKRGYVPEDIVKLVKDIPDTSLRIDVSLRFGQSEHVLKAVQFQGDEAEKTWSAISTLIIAGLHMELPHVLVEDGSRGFIMLRPSSYENVFREGIPEIIRKEFAEEIEKVKKLVC